MSVVDGYVWFQIIGAVIALGLVAVVGLAVGLNMIRSWWRRRRDLGW